MAASAEIIDRLRRQHRETEALLGEFRSALDGAAEAAQEALAACRGRLDREVAQHFQFEEGALFPVLARHVGSEGGPVGGMLSDHREIRRLAADFARALDSATRGTSGTSDDLRSSVEGLLALLPDHIEREEGMVFPLAENVLETEEWAEVSRLWDEAERAPTPPLSAAG